jgi:hypothetical protein
MLVERLVVATIAVRLKAKSSYRSVSEEPGQRH